MRKRGVIELSHERHTVTFNHEWLDDIVTDQLKVGMTNPVAYSGLGTSEKVVEDSDFMAKKHESVYQVGTDKTRATSDKNALALRRRKERHRRETSEGSIGDRIILWMVNRFGLIRI